VELLVVITIIGILIALLLPAVQAAREAARRMQCANNFKQVGLAVHNYVGVRGVLPTCMFLSGYCGAPSSGTNAINGSWTSFILPYMEQGAIYDQIRFDKHFHDPLNWTPYGTTIPAYLCPSDPQADPLVNFTGSITRPGRSPLEDLGRTNIVGVGDSLDYTCAPDHYAPRTDGDGVFMNYTTIRLEDITDGTSNTLLAGEVTGDATGSFNAATWVLETVADMGLGINGAYTIPGDGRPWTWPGTTGGPHSGFSSYHRGGCYFGMVDGSASFLSQNINQNVLAALATRAGKSSAGIPDKVLVSGPP
jgi:type II secretory pathway pseudopilin PulG